MAPRIDRDLRTDLVVGVLAAVFLVTVTPLALGSTGLEWPSYPLAAVTGLAFCARRRAPLLTLVVVVVAIAAYMLVNEDGGPVFGAAFAALASLAGMRPAGREWVPPTVAAIAVLTAAAVAANGLSPHLVPIVLLLLAAPRLAADRTRARRLRDAARTQESARRLVEERLRIAHEVHDVVGHGLATIALRAGVADHVAARDPQEAQAALRAIRRISAESLDELGSLLDVLRSGGVERAPVPDLAQVPRLVAGMREAGLDVRLEMEGDAAAPDVVGTAAYRIVQEALTNVVRHAGDGARARVRLVPRGRGLEVEVLDDGRAAAAPATPGRGLSGMRERAAALGGSFEAGARPGGGFRVWASLPGGRT
jgi:signal transduction histidine kinase